MKIKRRTNYLLIMCTTLFLVIILPLKAYAATVTGTKKNVTVSGYTYTYFSSTIKNSQEIFACVEIDCARRWPSGYVGLNSRLYNSLGLLVSSSGWLYDEVGGYGWSQPGGSTKNKGTYYSKGQVKFYNGNGYNTYTCNASPNLQFKSIKKSDYEINELGLTYGSDYWAATPDECPDLINVIGIHGKVGYVYNNDLTPVINSPTEAIKYALATPSKEMIPVYKSDGKTVIDTFILSYEKGIKK